MVCAALYLAHCCGWVRRTVSVTLMVLVTVVLPSGFCRGQ